MIKRIQGCTASSVGATFSPIHLVTVECDLEAWGRRHGLLLDFAKTRLERERVIRI
ncbi:MAG: hypothetical protein HYV63_27090 [Candidatus Schekmanbacteria bacterium]|nr:hypothetical protein [Candidatus Schekmanbacteria bacterium]